MEKSKLLYDLHTHTSYSHGKGSIRDNYEAARQTGLSKLGIADHGPGHLFFGLKMKDLPRMRQEVDRINKEREACGTEAPTLLLGVEANIINADGSLDLHPDFADKFDFIIAGYHFGILGNAPAKALEMHMESFFYSMAGWSTARIRNRNSMLVINALYGNTVKVLTHPGAKGALDIESVAAACAECGTLIEINDKHGHLTAEGIRRAAKYNVEFIIGSDAHSPSDVGRCSSALERAARAGLDPERIVNLRRREY